MSLERLGEKPKAVWKASKGWNKGETSTYKAQRVWNQYGERIEKKIIVIEAGSSSVKRHSNANNTGPAYWRAIEIASA